MCHFLNTLLENKTLGNIGLCSGRISDAKAEASSPVKVEWYLVWLSDDATWTVSDVLTLCVSVGFHWQSDTVFTNYYVQPGYIIYKKGLHISSLVVVTTSLQEVQMFHEKISCQEMQIFLHGTISHESYMNHIFCEETSAWRCQAFPWNRRLHYKQTKFDKWKGVIKKTALATSAWASTPLVEVVLFLLWSDDATDFFVVVNFLLTGK